jgi:tripartite-type tricarboxylate transporter receptor subunit TctC
MLRLLFAAAIATLCGGALAQDAYPTRKPITIVSPYPAGGASDALTRLLAESLRKTLGQQVAVQNITGAGGTIGSRHVAQAAPDGYTLLLHHFGMATGPFLYKNLQFDPLKSFEHIGLFAETSFVLVSHKDFPPDNMKEVAERIRQQKDKVSFATGGIGSGGHLFGIILEKSLGTKVTQVLYRGAAPALVDVLAGRVDLLCDSPGPIAQHVQSGNLKAFALTGTRRLTGMPNVPTVAEAGFPELTMSLWYGFYAPKGTPRPIVERLSQALQQAMKDPSVLAQLAKLDTQPFDLAQATPEALYRKLSSEMAHWGQVIQQAGVVPE